MVNSGLAAPLFHRCEGRLVPGGAYASPAFNGWMGL